MDKLTELEARVQILEDAILRGGVHRQGLDYEVTQLLKQLGVPANLLGFGYLRLAIQLCINDPSYTRSMSKRLYPAVAEEFDTTGSRAERAIRNAVTCAFENGDMDKIDEIFGYAYSQHKGKPTNGQFIAQLADHLAG